MGTEPKHNISSERALDLILSGQPLNDCYIAGQLKISGLDSFDKMIIVDNCIFEYFEGVSTQFIQLVRLSNSEFKNCIFTFSYFFGGLEINDCTFTSYLDFQAGGHNKNGNTLSILNSTFKNFVNFFDCWYESGVIIKNNDFQKGTNLLGKPNQIPVTFDVSPIIENNKGLLDIDNEGNS